MKAMYFANAAGNFNYNYNAITYTTSSIAGRVIVPVCLDAEANTATEKGAILQAGASFFCTAELSGSGTCCISAPPKTGPEAWYIEVEYPRNIELGTCYFNYIDQNGNIINDTLTYAQYRKTIIAQSNPLFVKSDSAFFENWMKWRVIERFPGQVLKYPHYNVPCTYTFQLKRDDPTDPGNYYFPYLTYFSGSINASSYVGKINNITFASLNATLNIVANNPPVDASSPNNRTVPCVWITSVVPVQTAFNLTSCQSTHSLWTTLDNLDDSYTTGSVLKVTNTELTTTSSCWTVSNLTSSLAVSVALTNVNVSASFGTCYTCISGSITHSFVSGANVIYDFGNPASYPGSGNTVFDISGYGINGSLINNPTWSSTNGGQLSLSTGSAQYIEFNTALSSSFTTMAIIKCKQSTWTNLNNGYSGFPCIKATNGVVVTGEVSNVKDVIPIMYYGGTPVIPSGTTIIPASIDTWRAYTFTTNGTNSHIMYLDNNISGSNTNTYTRGNGTVSGALIGHDPEQGAAGYLNGYVMGYLQYNRQLTQAEIDQNFAVFSSRF